MLKDYIDSRQRMERKHEAELSIASEVANGRIA
jgi:hypothetical protein